MRKVLTLSNNLQTKLGDGLSILQKEFEGGKQKLQNIKEVSKLNRYINELSQKKTKTLLELGQLTYLKIRTKQISDIDLVELTRSFTDIDKEIYLTLCKLGELNSIQPEASSCPHCGKAISESDQFCGGCGNKIDLKSKLQQFEQYKECVGCLVKIPCNSVYCPCCGIKND